MLMELTPTIIICSTEEVFSSSMVLDITPGLPYSRTEPTEGDSITGVIYFSGSATGYTRIHMSKDIADLVTRDFLFGEDLEVTEEVVHDTLRELANILAGRVKAYIDPPGSNLYLSLPELSLGNDFLPSSLSDAKRITIPFYLDDGEFWVEVQLAHECR